jgi:large repetitive protein
VKIRENGGKMKLQPDYIGRKSTIFIIIVLLAMVASGSTVAAAPLPAPRHIFINVANDAGVKYNLDGPNYGGPSNTYYIKADGGGLNELHITNDITASGGQVTATNAQSGTFYVSNTGGRGFDNDIILLLAVNGTIPDDFNVHIRSSGYTWTPAAPGVYQPDLPTDYQYVEGAVDETFTKSDFIYGPQTWKPGSGDLVTPSLPLFSGQNIADTSNQFQLVFIDLKAGNIEPGKYSGVTFANEGDVKIEYTFHNLTTFATFNGYGWCTAAFQGEGISWTNAMSAVSGGGGHSSVGSGYEVTGVPFAAFTSDKVTGNYPLTVQFTDQSIGATPASWQWNFGDGSPVSNLRNPSHTYTAGGSYTVTLTVSNPGGSTSTTKAGYIIIPKILPGQTRQPTDPDHDGLYEDLSGNGATSFTDVILFFNNLLWISNNEPTPAFDFSHNGGIAFKDIELLFYKVR